jgi:multicomponent K+:H+ antiporter subunit F
MSVTLTAALFFALVCYVAAMALALIRLLRGPTAQDRVLALDFLYVNGLLIVVALGISFSTTSYLEVALLIALFGFLGSAALAKFLLRGEVIE